MQVLASQVLNFLWLLAPKILTSCVSKVLAGKPPKHGIFASCESLRVLAAQELLAPLLARALFLGCTVVKVSVVSFMPNTGLDLSLLVTLFSLDNSTLLI